MDTKVLISPTHLLYTHSRTLHVAFFVTTCLHKENHCQFAIPKVLSREVSTEHSTQASNMARLLYNYESWSSFEYLHVVS